MGFGEMGVSGRVGSGALGLLHQNQGMRLERPGLEAELRLQDGGTAQNGREVEARPGVRLPSLGSPPGVLAVARIPLERSYDRHLSP